MIDGHTKVYSLFGFPVSHSLSPLIFNSTFEKLGQNRTYIPFSVRPEELRTAVEAAKAFGFEGFNVTMPHKTTITQLMNRLEGPAEKIGSVNTVARDSDRLYGYNTDGEGAIRAMKAHGFEPKGRRILVVGAGGASRAITHRLASEAERIEILNRDIRRAKEVADIASGSARTSYRKLTRTGLEESLKDAQLVVNSTPVRTTSLFRTLKVSQQALPRDAWVFDLAYDRPPAPLSVQVRRISPLEMLVQQAALSYEIWFGQPAPLRLMRSLLVDYNGGDWK